MLRTAPSLFLLCAPPVCVLILLQDPELTTSLGLPGSVVLDGLCLLSGTWWCRLYCVCDAQPHLPRRLPSLGSQASWACAHGLDLPPINWR